MTAAQLAEHIGRTGFWSLPGRHAVRVLVTVEDARETYGRLQYRIVPIAGQGTTWIDAQAVQLDPEVSQ